MHYKKDFPIFEREPDMVYLDSAATTHKPQAVIRAIADQLAYQNGSPHRGAHKGSVTATQLYVHAKQKVAAFIHAANEDQIIFTKNATEALNLIAYSYGLNQVKAHQNMVVAITAHHSNLVPWQMVAKQTGAELRFLYIDQTGAFTPESLAHIDTNTALVAFPIISNAYGIVHPVESLISAAKAVGAVTVLDAAQAVGHMPIDVQHWDCDFLVFSGHKLFAPQGIGVLYGKQSSLENLKPFLLGGDMIAYVTEQDTDFADLPNRLEAGTQNVTGAVGLAAAIDYIDSIGLSHIQAHEQSLVAYALKQLKELPWIRIIGPADSSLRGGLISFEVEDIHPHDVASLLDERGIAIRAGHHCCQPLMAFLKVPASCRISFSIYNDQQDVDALIVGLKSIREVFGYEC